MPAGPRLELRGISKRFGALAALDGVDLDLRGGEIHALLGENGAGKSTLMNVLYGLTQPDRGAVVLDGHSVRPRNPAEARRLGIGMVHQHFTVVSALTTAENFALGGERRGLRFDVARAAEEALELARRFGLDIGDPAVVSGDLSVGARQRIEILKALAGDTRILILDEPTAVLTPGEVEQLFSVLRSLRAEGRLVLLITHKLPEVRAVADRVAVLRRGRVVGGGTPAELSDDALATMMVGRSEAIAPPPRQRSERTLLRLEGIRLAPAAPPIDLDVRAGEIVAVVGVDGNGQSELFETLAGLRPPAAGRLLVAGEAVAAASPAAMQSAGIGVIPPDRRHDGLVGEMSVRENLVLSRRVLARFSSWGILRREAIARFAGEQADRYRIRSSALDAAAGTLSGGNQQRVVVARALAAEPRVLVAVNPTRGLDIAASLAVYDQLRAFVAAGNAVLLVSTDLDEALESSDRIGVLYRLRLDPIVEPPFPRERIGLAMASGGREVA